MPADRAAEVAAALARDPALFARAADVRAQNAALRDALDPMLAEPIPERLLEATSAPPAAARAGLPRWLRPAFAAAATLVLGIALGWFGRETTLERAGHADDLRPRPPPAPARSCGVDAAAPGRGVGERGEGAGHLAHAAARRARRTRRT